MRRLLVILTCLGMLVTGSNLAPKSGNILMKIKEIYGAYPTNHYSLKQSDNKITFTDDKKNEAITLIMQGGDPSINGSIEGITVKKCLNGKIPFIALISSEICPEANDPQDVVSAIIEINKRNDDLGITDTYFSNAPDKIKPREIQLSTCLVIEFETVELVAKPSIFSRCAQWLCNNPKKVAIGMGLGLIGTYWAAKQCYNRTILSLAYATLPFNW